MFLRLSWYMFLLLAAFLVAIFYAFRLPACWAWYPFVFHLIASYLIICIAAVDMWASLEEELRNLT